MKSRKEDKMKVAALFSGGKDSCYALYKILIKDMELVSLILVHPENPHSWMFHETNLNWSKLQAEAIGKPLAIVKTVGRKEEEIKDLEKCLAKLITDYSINAVISGAIASRYQKERIDKLCDKFGIDNITPLWGMDQADLLKEEIKSGFEIVITSCNALGFNKKWLGRLIDLECFEELISLNEKYGVNIAGEGGEYETFVVDGPLFKRRIRILEIEKIWSDYSGKIIIKDAKLENKD
jgi:ABC transporter with metal-binding/Fe-S-binding domain ATP-binding protein